MYQGRHGGDCDECEVYPPERSEGSIRTSHIATMSLEVHTTFCVQIGGKSRVACECVVSRGQSSFVRYEHFARWSGQYEHYRPLKRAVWTFRPILTPRHNWLHAALRTSMQCDFFRPFGHNSILHYKGWNTAIATSAKLNSNSLNPLCFVWSNVYYFPYSNTFENLMWCNCRAGQICDF